MIADTGRRLTVAYVMNKTVVPPSRIVGPIAAALAGRVYDLVNR